MEVSEFRIGNIVYVGYSGTREVIRGIIDPSINLQFNGGNYHGLIFNYESVGNMVIELDICEPIPLTRLELLKLGFEEKGNHYFQIKTGWYERDWNYKPKQSKLVISCKPELEKCYVISPANGTIALKYIHEVQNLYFALTNTELNGKPIN